MTMNFINRAIKSLDSSFRESYSEERTVMPLKFLLTGSLTVVVLFVLGSYLWPGLTFVYIWLFLLSMWAILHVKKSSSTWLRFDEIDQRETDYAEEVDRRFDQLHKEVKALRASLKPPKDDTKKSPRKKGRPKKAKSSKKAVPLVETTEGDS